MHVRSMEMHPYGDAASTLFHSRVAVVNTKGNKDTVDYESLGQDCVSVSLLPTGWEVLCLADGHGLGGEWPAAKAVQAIPFFLAGPHCSQRLQDGEVEKALEHVFAEVQADLESSAMASGRGLDFAGTTASVILRHPTSSTVWVAHIGDSRVILVSESGALLGATQDHKADVPSEKARLESCGAQVTSGTRALGGGPLLRVFVPGTTGPGLAVSRSFGDMALKDFGIFAEPEIMQWVIPIGAEVHCVIASDGLWDFFSNDEVGMYIAKNRAMGRDPQETVKDLMERARERWAAQGLYCDDISIVTATFDTTSKWKQVPALISEAQDQDCVRQTKFQCCVSVDTHNAQHAGCGATPSQCVCQ